MKLQIFRNFGPNFTQFWSIFSHNENLGPVTKLFETGRGESIGHLMGKEVQEGSAFDGFLGVSGVKN